MRQQDGTPRQDNELVFVNIGITGPTGSKSGIRKLVRSRATVYSHRDPSRKQRSLGGSRARPETSIARAESDERITATLQRHAAAQVLAGNAKDWPPRIMLDGSHADPFSTYPVPAQPWFHWVLDFYRTVHLPRGISVVQRTSEEGESFIE